MKTSSAPEAGLSESGINARLSHKSFLDVLAKTPHSKSKKNIRNVDKKGQSFYAMLGIEDFTAQSKASVHPEFVVFAYHLYGLPRRLLMYIIFYEMKNDSGRFKLDAETMERFHRFCNLFGEKEESMKAIMQAARSLIRKNIMIEVGEQEYMVNPLVAGGANEKKRRKLIDTYSELLQKKGLDIAIDFYPRYLPTL